MWRPWLCSMLMTVAGLLVGHPGLSDNGEVKLLAHSDGETCGKAAPQSRAEAAADKLQVTIQADQLNVVFSGLQFNCCLSELVKSVAYDAEHRVIYARAQERFSAGKSACRCQCPFLVSWLIKAPGAGRYTLKIQTGHQANGGWQEVGQRDIVI